jgi:hypothetical protein
MDHELEPIGEQTLNHGLIFLLGRVDADSLRRDVEALGVEPLRPAHDLEILQLIRVPDDVAQRIVRHHELTTWPYAKRAAGFA